mgnify:FL=1
MPAYVVATMAIHDPATYRKYTDRTPATIKRYGGKFLTRGTEVTTTEGEKLTDRMVILEFPSKQHIEDWMKDPEYQEIAKFRHAAAKTRGLVQEGSANTENPSPHV